jgi:hypothetical protein
MGLPEIVEASKNGAVLAEATLHRALHELRILDKKFPTDPDLVPGECQDWFKTMQNMVAYTGQVEEGFSTLRAYALTCIKHHWDDLPQATRQIFNNDFFKFAVKQTGKSPVTIENHIRAIETFYFDTKKLPKSVNVPVRDNNQSVMVDPKGNPKTEFREFDALKVPISKLVLVRSRAEKETMTADLWSMVADPGCSWEQLQLAVSKGGGGEGEIKFRVEGPFLVAVEGNTSTVLGELECWYAYYNDKSSLAHRALAKIITALSIQMDEETIRKEELKGETENAYNKGRWEEEG